MISRIVGFGMLGVLGLAAIAQAQPASPPARKSRADRPPRKVVVGTVTLRPSAIPRGLETRLERLGELVDAMAREADRKHPGHGLDLAILPEQFLTLQDGPALKRAVPLEGRVQDAVGAVAARHRSYLVAPLDLAETGPGGTTCANAAVLFDRQGKVAGIYRKVHPVALVGSSELEGGITPGREFPVFECDFGRLGLQICWDIVYDDGWQALAEKGAELVAWPSASPATAQPAARAGRHRYFIASSTWRDNATVFEPTGLVAAQVESPGTLLVHEIDLSFAVLEWSPHLRDGQALSDAFGKRVGYHYEPRQDLGLFWSNDPDTTIGQMIGSLGLEEIDVQIERNRKLQDAARGGPAPRD